MATQANGSYVLKAFPAMGERNFSLYFWGYLTSSVGTWLQSVTEGWLIYHITGSAFWVSLVAAMMTLPGATPLAPLGGALCDRFDLRKVIYATNAAAMIQAFVFAWLALSGRINRWEILGLSLFLGVITAIDSPARQSLIRRAVSDENLASANALQTALVHGAMLLGKGLGALLILVMSVGWTFVLNGITFGAVMLSIRYMKLEPHRGGQVHGFLAMVHNGVRYTWKHAELSFLMACGGAMVGLGFPVQTMLIPLSEQWYHGTHLALSMLVASSSAGAVLGALILSRFSRSFHHLSFMAAGALVTGSMYLTISFIFRDHLFLSLLLLIGGGVGFTIGSTSVRIAVQQATELALQGRVMGIFIMTFFASITLGNILIGAVAHRMGSIGAVRLHGFLLIILSGVIFKYGSKRS